MRVERVAAHIEDGFENVAFGEDSRARVDTDSVDDILVGLAARAAGGFANGDVASVRGKERGAGQPADPGTDNDDAFGRHHILRLAISQYVNQTGQMQSSNKLSIRSRAILFRNRMIGNARFRDLLSQFPGTRGFVRRRANAMFDINAGFIYSQIALAMVETLMFDALAAGPLSVADAARHGDLPETGAERLLKAAASLDLAEMLDDGRYVLGERGAAVHADPGISAMIAHHRHLYRDLADPVALLRRGGGGGALAAYWAYARSSDPAGSDADAIDSYSALMATSQTMVAAQVTGAYDFGRQTKLLDVGGGEGVFARAVRDASPRLEVAVFDLPAVAERAKEVQHFGGDFFEDALPTGFDIISVVRILHDHDDAPVMKLLRNIFTSLPPGGTILIAEPMADTRGSRAMGDGYFGMYLWAMGSGRPRSAETIKGMLGQTGFVQVTEVRTALPLIARIITARRSVNKN